jgi:phosphotransferase family enzyme
LSERVGVTMVQLDTEKVRQYFEGRFGGPVRVLGLSVLGQEPGAGELKGYGYGVPVKVDYELDGRRQSAVLETVTPGPFGHEHMADRAQILLWSHGAFNRLPRHVRSLDVGGFSSDGSLVSVGNIDEFFILNEFVPGVGYYCDLERLRDGGDLQDLDLARVDALCDYLGEIHRVRKSDPSLYVRRTRELIGHHECIMGVLDSYPPEFDGLSADILKDIERGLVDWRWRLKGYAHRLRQVHGDFHPWNILFQQDADFVVLDRSRGEWGDPADDITALTINYLFFSLQRSGRLDGSFATLFSRFWQRYLKATGDDELQAVVGPFFAFRGLVVANPVWYPKLGPGVRVKLLNFVRAVLDRPRFDPACVNEYCRG